MKNTIPFFLTLILSLPLFAENNIFLYDAVREHGYFYDNPALLTLNTNLYIHLDNKFEFQKQENIDNMQNRVRYNVLNNDASLFVLSPVSKKIFLQIEGHLALEKVQENKHWLTDPETIYQTNNKARVQNTILLGLARNMNKELSLGYSFQLSRYKANARKIDNNLDGAVFDENYRSIKNTAAVKYKQYAFNVFHELETVTADYGLPNQDKEKVTDFARYYAGAGLEFFHLNNNYLNFLVQISYTHRMDIKQNCFLFYHEDFNTDSLKDNCRIRILAGKNFQPVRIFTGLQAQYQTLEKFDPDLNYWKICYKFDAGLEAGVEFPFLRSFRFYLVPGLMFDRNDTCKKQSRISGQIPGGLVYVCKNLELELRNKPEIIIEDYTSENYIYQRLYKVELILRCCY